MNYNITFFRYKHLVSTEISVFSLCYEDKMAQATLKLQVKGGGAVVHSMRLLLSLRFHRSTSTRGVCLSPCFRAPHTYQLSAKKQQNIIHWECNNFDQRRLAIT